MADARHVHPVRADGRALTAERAGVHGLIELMVAHDDLRVVVNFPRQQPGVLPVMAQIGAGFEALLAAALEAALRLLDRLLRGIADVRARHALQRLRGGEVGVKPALNGALRAARVAGIELLREPVCRQRRLFRAEGRVHHAAAAAYDQVFRLIEHHVRRTDGPGEEGLRRRLRRAENLIVPAPFAEEFRRQCAAELEPDLFSPESFQLQRERFPVQKRRGAAEKRFLIGLGAEHRDRVHFLFQLAREKQRKEPRAEHGGLLLFRRAKHAPAPRLFSVTRDCHLDRADGDALSALAEAADSLARRLTALREHQRKRRDFLIQLQRLFEVPVRRRLQQRAGIELQRAGRVAKGGLLIDAALHHALNLLLGDLAHVVDVGRAALLNLTHHRTPFRL